VNFANWFITRLSIKLFANRLELDISVFKTNLFRKDITLRIAAIDNVDCAIIFLKKILLIASDRSNDSLFNTSEDIFNRKRITDVLRQRLRLLDYDNYYISHFFRRDAVTEARNADVPETIIMLLDR